MDGMIKHRCVLPPPGTLVTLGGCIEYIVVRHSRKGFIAKPLSAVGREFEVRADSNFKILPWSPS